MVLGADRLQRQVTKQGISRQTKYAPLSQGTQYMSAYFISNNAQSLESGHEDTRLRECKINSTFRD
jgi:hypothetical protein